MKPGIASIPHFGQPDILLGDIKVTQKARHFSKKGMTKMMKFNQDIGLSLHDDICVCI